MVHWILIHYSKTLDLKQQLNSIITRSGEFYMEPIHNMDERIQNNNFSQKQDILQIYRTVEQNRSLIGG